MDKRNFEELQEENILDAMIIHKMDLPPHEFAGISSTLHTLSWLKAMAKDEGIPIEKMDRKYIIKKVLNRELTDKKIEEATMELKVREQR